MISEYYPGHIFSMIFNENRHIGVEIQKYIIEQNNSISYIPRKEFGGFLSSEKEIEEIWSLLSGNTFLGHIGWKLAFFENLDESFIDERQATRLIEVIESISESVRIFFDGLVRFTKVRPDILAGILAILYQKIHVEGIDVQIWNDIYTKHFEHIKANLSVAKKMYTLQSLKYKYFDLDRKGFLNILKENPEYLLEYFGNDEVLSSLNHSSAAYHNFNIVWQIDNIEKSLTGALNILADNIVFFGISEHMSNIFFSKLNEEEGIQADAFLLDYVKTNINDSKRMDMAIDIARNARSKMFDEVLAEYVKSNQSVEDFRSLKWLDSGGIRRGDTIFGDLRAAEWREIYTVVSGFNLGAKTLGIRQYILDCVEDQKRSAERERMRKFLSRD